MIPYTFHDHWRRIEPSLTEQPLSATKIHRLCGLGIANTAQTLSIAARNGLCGRVIHDPYDSKKRGSYHREQPLYFRKSALQ